MEVSMNMINSRDRDLITPEAEKEEINTRIAELHKEVEALTEYNSSVTEEELRFGIINLWKSFIPIEQATILGIVGFDGESFIINEEASTTWDDMKEKAKEINENIENSVNNILHEAYKDIDYVDYIHEVSTFAKQQLELQIQGKPSLEFASQNANISSAERFGGYQPYNRKLTMNDFHELTGPTVNPLGRLYNLALYGTDLYSTILQHEIIHHYQRVKEKSPILRLLKLYKLSSGKSFKILPEIHARLHDSFLGPEERSDEEILSLLSNEGYGLSEEQKTLAKNAIAAIKKLYALDVSNRRIATLVRENKNLGDISKLTEEINKIMSEKNITYDDLDTLVEIDDLQRLVVHLRTKKLARQEIDQLKSKA